MKTIYMVFIALTISFSSALQAQSLQILTMDDVDVSGTEQSFSGSISDSIMTIVEHFKIKNSSSADIDVVVRKEYIDVLEGIFDDFCWAGACLSGSIMVSNSMTVAAGAEQETFDLHYHCQGIEGVSTIRYTAFDQNNPTDAVSFTVDFVVEATRVESLNDDILIRDVYPNPAKENAVLNYNLSGNSNLTCEVYDMLGKRVYSEFATGQGAIEIPVRNLPQGTYFCRLIIDGKLVETQKLMVQ